MLSKILSKAAVCILVTGLSLTYVPCSHAADLKPVNGIVTVKKIKCPVYTGAETVKVEGKSIEYGIKYHSSNNGKGFPELMKKVKNFYTGKVINNVKISKFTSDDPPGSELLWKFNNPKLEINIFPNTEADEVVVTIKMYTGT